MFDLDYYGFLKALERALVLTISIRKNFDRNNFHVWNTVKHHSTNVKSFKLIYLENYIVDEGKYKERVVDALNDYFKH